MADKGTKGRVLVVDDQPAMRRLLCRVLTEDGYDVQEAGDGEQALALALDRAFDLVITDLAMPRLDGLGLLQELAVRCEGVAVVLITAYGTVPSAVAAMKHGAFDYLTKPLDDPDAILTVAACAMAKRRHNAAAPRVVNAPGLLYRHESMARVIAAIARVACSAATVLITGESGTGKEAVARLIHDQSPRKDGPFVAVNAAALSETLLETELFGHERGAFTGAEQRHAGRFEQAQGGTLFLDEVGETSAALQTKLLRVLQERVFERVGGTQTLNADVRVIAATNRDLPAAVAARRFREDLFYRLAVVELRLPPLRERGDDVLLLAEAFLTELAVLHGRQIKGFSEAAKTHLVNHDWPGNVRELRNAVERGILFAVGHEVDIEVRTFPSADGRERTDTLDLKAVERDAITRALERADGNRRKAADLLGISLRTLHYKLNEYGLRDE